MSSIVEDMLGISSAQREAEEAQGAANRAALAAMGLAYIPAMFRPEIPGQKGLFGKRRYIFKQVKVVPGVTLGPLTLPLKTVDGPTQPAPETLPLETVDVPTASYLEMVEDQAIKQQKALAGKIKSSGFVSEQQGQELAMSPAEKPADLTWAFLIGLVGVLATKLGSKLWK